MAPCPCLLKPLRAPLPLTAACTETLLQASSAAVRSVRDDDPTYTGLKPSFTQSVMDVAQTLLVA